MVYRPAHRKARRPGHLARAVSRTRPKSSRSVVRDLADGVLWAAAALGLACVLLTGIGLMRTGEVEANLLTLNESFRLACIPDLVARKLAGPEQSQLADDDLAFHEAEYERLRAELQAAHEASRLPESPSPATRAALNDLLVRLRMTTVQRPSGGTLSY